MISVSWRRSEQRGVLNSRVSWAVWIPACCPTLPSATPCTMFSALSPLAAEINLCLGGRWSQHTWTCTRARHGTLGPCPGGALANAHARELECLQGCENTADVPGMAEDHGRHSGFVPSGNFELSSFCSPSDRIRGCVASGWCPHFRFESSETGRMRKSCLSLCSWHLGWFWVGYSLS